MLPPLGRKSDFYRREKMKPTLSTIFCCVFVLAAYSIHAETALDIDTTVSLALNNNFAIERARIETAGAKRKADRSWNSLIPSLGANAFINRPTPLVNSGDADGHEWTPGLSFSASMLLSPAVFMDIRQTKEEYELGVINYETARQELEFQVRRLYYQLLLLKENVSMTHQNTASAQSRHEQTLALRRTGQASNLDELSARLDLQTQKTNAQNAETLYANAVDGLKTLLMLPEEETITLNGSLDFSIGIATGAMAAARHKESLPVVFLRKSIETLATQRKAAQTHAYAPVLNLSWTASPIYTNDVWMDPNGQFSVTLSLALDNFFPGSAAKEQIDSLRDSLTLQQSLLQETVMNSRNAARQLERAIAQSVETLETLALNVTLAEETRDMYEAAYRQGTSDFQSLRSARDSLSSAQNSVLEERYNLAEKILELEKELAIPFGSLSAQ
jgi:outer membrane protein TolC